MPKNLAASAVVALLATLVSSCSSDGPGLPLASPTSSSSAATDPSLELFGKLRAAAKTVRTVITDDTGVYLRVAGRNAPGGKPWVRYRQLLPVAYLQVFAAFGVLVGPASPMFSVALKPGATNVRKRLEMTEAGVRVTPYAMDLDPAKVSTAASILQKFNGTGGQVDGSLSVDQRGRPVSIGIRGSNSGARFSLAVSYSKYDSPVTIAAPPASQVAG